MVCTPLQIMPDLYHTVCLPTEQTSSDCGSTVPNWIKTRSSFIVILQSESRLSVISIHDCSAGDRRMTYYCMQFVQSAKIAAI